MNMTKIREIAVEAGIRHVLYRVSEGLNCSRSRPHLTGKVVKSKYGDYPEIIYIHTKARTFHVIASASERVDEVMLFPANRHGKIIDYSELWCERGTLDAERVAQEWMESRNSVV